MTSLDPEPSPSPGRDDVVGLVPAAGRGTRLGPLAGSKEILPLTPTSRGAASPDGDTALDRLLRDFATSGIRRALVLLRKGKEDIPARIGSGRRHGLEVAYRVLEATGSPVETLDAARPFLQGACSALAFPDILYHPADSLGRLAAEQSRTGAAVVLGLFPCDAPERSDMVELGADGSVVAVRIKEPDRGLRWAWGQAVWDGRFTALLHRTFEERGDHPEELQPGHVVRRALEEGLPVRAVPFPDGVFLDTGTPEGLQRAVAWLEGGHRGAGE